LVTGVGGNKTGIQLGLNIKIPGRDLIQRFLKMRALQAEQIDDPAEDFQNGWFSARGSCIFPPE
jgi:hypothetical protein